MTAHPRHEGLQALGRQIAGARNQQHLSQDALGERVGVSRRAITDIEGGRSMRLSTLAAVLNELHMELIAVPIPHEHEYRDISVCIHCGETK